MSGQKFKKDATKLLTRYPKPVMHVDDFPGIAQLYNPAVVKYNDEFIMLVSVVDYAADGEGTDVGETRIARSKDGINFENFRFTPEIRKYFFIHCVHIIFFDFFFPNSLFVPL